MAARCGPTNTFITQFLHQQIKKKEKHSKQILQNVTKFSSERGLKTQTDPFLEQKLNAFGTNKSAQPEFFFLF